MMEESFRLSLEQVDMYDNCLTPPPLKRREVIPTYEITTVDAASLPNDLVDNFDMKEDKDFVDIDTKKLVRSLVFGTEQMNEKIKLKPFNPVDARIEKIIRNSRLNSLAEQIVTRVNSGASLMKNKSNVNDKLLVNKNQEQQYSVEMMDVHV